MATYDRGRMVVVQVPFSDGSGFKARPALVVSSKAFHRGLPDLIICPVSSQPRYISRPGPGDYPLRNWKRAGLRHASTVRISKLLSIDKRLIQRALKPISPEDLRNVERLLRTALGL